MERDYQELHNNVSRVQNQVRSGNKKALEDLPHHMADLLDTMRTNLGAITLYNHEARDSQLDDEIDKVKRDLRTLTRAVNDFTQMMAAKHNDLAEEVFKMKRIFETIMEIKEQRDADKEVD